MTRGRVARGTKHYLRAGISIPFPPRPGGAAAAEMAAPAAFPALATHAIEPTNDAPTAVRVLRNMDIAVLAIALPLFIVADINILGWVTGTALYVGQRAIRALVTRRAEKADDPRTTVGLLAGSMIARGWIVAGIIFAVGMTTESEVGLSSAVLFLAAFTMSLTMALATGGASGMAGAMAAGPLPGRETKRPPE